MITAQQRIEQLLGSCASPQACVAYLLCDRHPADAVAFTIVEADLSSQDLSFGELRERSRRAAAALASLGVEPGDRVATLMGKSADLVVALLGIWRRGAVHVPLFTAFAPPAIGLRLGASATKVVIVDADQRHKLLPGEDIAADAPWKIVVAGGATPPAGDAAFGDLLDAQHPDDPCAQSVVRGGDGEIIRLFTSGTTGSPKGVPVPARTIASFLVYFEYGLGVRQDDVFWNAADPGWAYGLYYSIIAPLAAGYRSLLLHAGFTPELTYAVLSKFRVTNFAAAPTVYRVLRSSPVAIPDDLALQRCSSAGEPLNPEMIAWAERSLGVPVHDTYGQTELGMCIINGWHPEVARPLKPGSMGQAMPGWAVEVLLDDRDEIAPPGEMGRVAVDMQHSPLMWFSGYADAPKKSAERFSPDRRWYYTGDAGARDAEGYLFFSSRDDDIIIMAGYRIGPFEVESVLVTHPDVVEVAVVGVPEELRGEVIEAFVVLRSGALSSNELARDLQQLVKQKFAAHAYPRSVHFVAELPKTPSGKVQRYLLRAQRRQELAAQAAPPQAST